SGLINVDIGAVAVNIGDITVADVVDVNDVLNENKVRILDNVLNNNPILNNNSDILTNLLRDADILNDVQVVVGVLDGPTFVVQALLPKPAPSQRFAMIGGQGRAVWAGPRAGARWPRLQNRPPPPAPPPRPYKRSCPCRAACSRRPSFAARHPPASRRKT